MADMIHLRAMKDEIPMTMAIRALKTAKVAFNLKTYAYTPQSPSSEYLTAHGLTPVNW